MCSQECIYVPDVSRKLNNKIICSSWKNLNELDFCKFDSLTEQNTPIIFAIRCFNVLNSKACSARIILSKFRPIYQMCTFQDPFLKWYIFKMVNFKTPNGKLSSGKRGTGSASGNNAENTFRNARQKDFGEHLPHP